MDCTAAGQALCQRFGVQGFPTLKFFGEDKSRPKDFDGARDADSIVTYVRNHADFAQPKAEVRLDLSTIGSGPGDPRVIALPHRLQASRRLLSLPFPVLARSPS